MNKSSISFKQGYDQGFSDAICHEDNALGYAVTDGERDWADGYYEGHVAGESALLSDSPPCADALQEPEEPRQP